MNPEPEKPPDPQKPAEDKRPPAAFRDGLLEACVAIEAQAARYGETATWCRTHADEFIRGRSEINGLANYFLSAAARDLRIYAEKLEVRTDGEAFMTTLIVKAVEAMKGDKKSWTVTTEIPKGATAPTRRKSPPTRRSGKRKNPWKHMTAEQRLQRINAIRRGKGLPPRKE